jgi:glycine betaine/proline transport system permease protein
MVVTASMIGARGLGEDVLNGIQSLDVGKGFEAGLAIVVLALALDRMAQALAGAAGPTDKAPSHG